MIEMKVVPAVLRSSKREEKDNEDIVIQWIPIFSTVNKQIDLIGKFVGHGAFTDCYTGDIYAFGGMSPDVR